MIDSNGSVAGHVSSLDIRTLDGNSDLSNGPLKLPAVELLKDNPMAAMIRPFLGNMYVEVELVES